MPARKTKPDDRLMCRHCRLPIQGAVDRRRAVWLGVSIALHGECYQKTRQAVDDMIAAAVAAGTHSTGPALQVCEHCREWREMYHVTPAGEHLCKGCAPPDAVPERVRRVVADAAHE